MQIVEPDAAAPARHRVVRRAAAETQLAAREGPPFVIDETVSISPWPRSLTRPKCPLPPFPHEYQPLQERTE